LFRADALCLFFCLDAKEPKNQGGRKIWLKFTAFRYGEEAYYVALNFY
jgi:hypothetical protein